MAEIRENGILGQESVSRVDGLSSGLEKVRRCSSKERKKKKLANLGSRLLGNLDDLIHNEVALLGGRRTNQVRLISLSEEEEEIGHQHLKSRPQVNSHGGMAKTPSAKTEAASTRLLLYPFIFFNNDPGILPNNPSPAPTILCDPLIRYSFTTPN